MAGVTKVNGSVKEGQFFGREILSINIDTLVAAPTDVGTKDANGRIIAWPELDAAIQAIETICTVSLVGAHVATNTEVNVLVEGLSTLNATDRAAEIVRLDALVGAATVGGNVTENAL